MALSLESLLADRRAHKNHLTNQSSRLNTPTPSPTAPTQAGKTRNRRKRKPRKTHKTTNLDTTSVINLSHTPLSIYELLVLARGLTFCPTPKRINLAESSADIIPWVPQVFLACGGKFRCWPKADMSSAVGRSREKNGRVTIKT